MGSIDIVHKMKIPNKIGVLLRHLIKEVVRNQPNDLYEFSAECIDSIIAKGENALFDGTLGAGDDDIFTVRPPSHIRALIEETPVIPMLDSDDLASAEEMRNYDGETAGNPFLKVEISPIAPSLEAPGVEPLELGDLSDPVEPPVDLTEGDDGQVNQESLVEETSIENEAGYQADESLNVVDETVDTTEETPTIEETAVEEAPVEEVPAEEAPLEEVIPADESESQDQPTETEEVPEVSPETEETAKEDGGAEETSAEAPTEEPVSEELSVIGQDVAEMAEEQQAEEVAAEDQPAQEESEQQEEGILETVEPSELEVIEEESADVAEESEAAAEAVEEQTNQDAQEDVAETGDAANDEPPAGEETLAAEPAEANEEPAAANDEPVVGDDETLVEDEEEIWNQLQRDIEQEEANQQELAALRIQSTYRGYRVRKSVNHSGGENNEDTGDGAQEGELENEGTGEVDDTVGPMADDTTCRPPLSRTTSVTLPEDDRLREEMLVEERMDSVEIVETYVINIQDPDESASCETKQDEEEELSEPETFELHIKSDETDKDGLVEASWYDNDLKPGEDGYPSHYLEDILESDEHVLAAIKIQSGYRGYKERKRYSEKKAKSVRRDLADDEMDRAALKIQAGYRGYATRKRITAERGAREIVPDIVTDEEELIYGNDHAAAALAIQNTFRNKMKRRQQESMSVESTPRDQDQFLSAGPSHSLEDEDLNNAAVRIQSGYRGYAARKQVKKEKDAATKIQAGYRGYSARKQIKTSEKYLAVPQVDQEELTQAAAKIQANYRGYATRKQLKNRKNPEDEEERYIIILDDDEMSQAATKIQANYRGYAARKQLKNTPRSYEEPVIFIVEEDDDLVNAATKIQANYRGYATRRQLSSPRVKQMEDDDDLANAATKIQAGYRGYATRRQLKSQRVKQVEDDDDLVNAATKIQAGYRGYATRKQLKSRQMEEPEDDGDLVNAATKIQANYRGYTTRRQLSSQRGNPSIVENELDENEKAAIKIQANYRGYATRKRMAKPRHQHTEDEDDDASNTGKVYEKSYDDDEALAATRIQANYRGYRTRRKLKDEKSEGSLTGTQTLEEDGAIQNDAEVFNYGDDHENAAVKVQACYRGYSTRKKMKNNAEQ